MGRLAGLLIDLGARLRHRDADGLLSTSHGRGDIAAYLGVTLETVSRSFSDLDYRDVVRVRGKPVEILGPTEPRRLAAT